MFKSHLHDEDRDGDDDHHDHDHDDDDGDVHQSPSRLPVNLTTLAQGSVVTIDAVPQLAMVLQPGYLEAKMTSIFEGQTPQNRAPFLIKRRGPNLGSRYMATT